MPQLQQIAVTNQTLARSMAQKVWQGAADCGHQPNAPYIRLNYFSSIFFSKRTIFFLSQQISMNISINQIQRNEQGRTHVSLGGALAEKKRRERWW
jgi:hypothetical protein